MNEHSKVSRRRFMRTAFSVSTLAGVSPLIGAPSAAAEVRPKPRLGADRVSALVGNFIERMEVRPSATRQASIASLVSTLVENRVWDRLDGLYVFAAHDVQVARLNWVQQSFDITSVNSPAFEKDVGFAGDGVAAFLDTNAKANSLDHFKPNDATMGVYVREPHPSDVEMDIGLVNSYLNVCGESSDICLRANSASGRPVTVPTSPATKGLIAWSRDAARVHTFSSGECVASEDVAVGQLKNSPVTILRVESNYSTRLLSAAVVGAALSVHQHNALSAALDSYLIGIGYT